jgi:transposase
VAPWASRRRQKLLELWDGLQPEIQELDREVVAEAERRSEVVKLMAQKGMGPVNGLAFVLTLGRWSGSPTAGSA